MHKGIKRGRLKKLWQKGIRRALSKRGLTEDQALNWEEWCMNLMVGRYCRAFHIITSVTVIIIYVYIYIHIYNYFSYCNNYHCNYKTKIVFSQVFIIIRSL